jgi:hypothetical protein
MAQFWVHHAKRQRGTLHGGGTDQVVVVVGLWGCKTQGGEGVWVKNQKLSHRGSVSGAPCGMGMADGAWGWHGGMYQAVVVVGSCGCETQGEGGLGEKPETKPPWLSFRHAV